MASVRTRSIIAELEALRDADGMIHADASVKWAARHKRSALYAYLEWDDTVAAHRHRVDQVRSFIQVHIVDAVGFRRYISLSIDRQTSGGYRPIPEVLSRQDLKSVMLNDALDDLDRMRRLYISLNELQPIWDCIDRLRPRSAA